VQTSDVPVAYPPAPLDLLSLNNGVAKYVHPQQTVDSSFFSYACDVLDYFFPAMVLNSEPLSEEAVREITLDTDHASRACGYPWDTRKVSTKKQAVEQFAAEFRDCPFHFLSGTLKDELRPIGKDARLFRMQPVHDFERAQKMYHNQNEYLASRLFRSPIFVKFCTPGVDLTILYEMLRRFCPDCFDADGSAWDANFQLLVAEIIAFWRGQYLPEGSRKAHKEYYRAIYNGYTIIAGWLLHVIGQASGHLNTTTDNSLGNIIHMSYVAWKNNLSVKEFVSQILFFVCGDDLIWSNRTVFTAREVGYRYAEMGMYLEFSSLEPSDVLQCTFAGTLPVQRDRIRYHGRLEKLQASMCYKKKANTVRDVIAKMASLCMLSYYGPLYVTFREMTMAYLSARTKEEPSWLADAAVASYIQCMQPEFLDKLYNSWECSFSRPKLPPGLRL